VRGTNFRRGYTCPDLRKTIPLIIKMSIALECVLGKPAPDQAEPSFIYNKNTKKNFFSVFKIH
jgi:hypothetical protein